MLSTKSIQTWLPYRAGPATTPQKCLRTPQPVNSYLRLAGSRELPKRHCGTGLGLPPSKPFLFCGGSATMAKRSYSLWGRASSQDAPCDTAPAVHGAETESITKAVRMCRFHQTNAVGTWLFAGGLNTEKMVPSYRPHVCQVPHRDSGSCLSSSHATATQLSPSLHVPGPPELSTLHQRPGECPQASKSMCGFYKKVPVFPASLYPIRKVR